MGSGSWGRDRWEWTDGIGGDMVEGCLRAQELRFLAPRLFRLRGNTDWGSGLSSGLMGLLDKEDSVAPQRVDNLLDLVGVGRTCRVGGWGATGGGMGSDGMGSDGRDGMRVGDGMGHAVSALAVTLPQ